MKRRPKNLSLPDFAVWFWDQLKVDGECRVWMRCKSHGFGVLRLRGKMYLTHRTAWYLTYGNWPKQVNHKCGNRPCCLPEHLYEGTPAENAQDARFQGANKHYKLDPEKVAKIKERRAQGALQQEIADEFGVSISMISLVLRGKKWTNIPETKARLIYGD